MRKLFLLAALVAAVVAGGGEIAPRPRPAEWATPMINASLENCYRVSEELFRCEQPEPKDAPALHALGVKSILSLRNYHSNPPELKAAGFELLAEPMKAGKLTMDDLVAALRQFRHAPKPVMVHCWHGSDRTGSVVAAYRIVFQDWTPAAALDELRHGGFGYHERWFPNIIELFGKLDAGELRRRVLADEPVAVH